jgi:septal ring factor EnvC (AmiA/AmiB activator)
MRSTWTDSRLDDFAAHTDKRFDAVDRRFDAVDRRFDRVDQEIRGLRGEINGVRTEIGALQRTIIQVGGGLIAAVVGVILTQL